LDSNCRFEIWSSRGLRDDHIKVTAAVVPVRSARSRSRRASAALIVSRRSNRPRHKRRRQPGSPRPRTGSSNPSLSRGESVANLIPLLGATRLQGDPELGRQSAFRARPGRRRPPPQPQPRFCSVFRATVPQHDPPDQAQRFRWPPGLWNRRHARASACSAWRSGAAARSTVRSDTLTPCSRSRSWAHHITVAAVPPEAGEDAGGGRGGADGAVAPVGLGDAADCRGVGVQPEHGETLSGGAPRSSAGAKIAIRLTSGCRACCTSMGR
jgi:hypothetical protein